MATTPGYGYQGPPPPAGFYPPPPPPPKYPSGYDGFQSTQSGYQQPQGLPYPPPSTGFNATYTGYPSNVVVPAPIPQQQQQQQVVVINRIGRSTPVYRVNTFSGQVALSCVVIWFCNVVFGLIAFILASIANSTVVADPDGARTLGRASYGMSIAGIVSSIIIIATVLGVVYGSPTYYYYYG